MARTVLVPNAQFTRRLMAVGAADLKKCYQCATCSVACPLSSPSHPFPRKEMIWASFGLEDKLMTDPDVWICHNCGKCSDLCPRGAQPAQLMSAARDMVYQDIVMPGTVARWMSSPKGLLWLIAIPAILWLIVWGIRADLAGSWFPRTDGRIVFGAIFNGDYTIDPIFMLTFFGALAILAVGARRLWQNLTPEGGVTVLGKVMPWWKALWHVLWEEVISAKRFAECNLGPKSPEPERSRRVSHTLMVWSFCILAFVTTVVAIGHWGGRIFPSILIVTPMPMTFWVKIIANIGAIMLLAALILLTWRRLCLNPKTQSSSYYDWYLLGIIWAVGLTGILTQTFRLMDNIHAAFIIYYLHLVSIWMLFAYVPWSKLGHFVYRTVAMVHVKMYGRR